MLVSVAGSETNFAPKGSAKSTKPKHGKECNYNEYHNTSKVFLPHTGNYTSERFQIGQANITALCQHYGIPHALA